MSGYQRIMKWDSMKTNSDISYSKIKKYISSKLWIASKNLLWVRNSRNAFKYVWIILTVNVGMNLASLIIFLIVSKQYKIESPLAVATLVIDLLIFMVAYLTAIFREKLQLILKRRKYIRPLFECARLLLWFVYLIFIGLKICYAVAVGVKNPLCLGKEENEILNLSHETKVTLMILLGFSIVSDFLVGLVLTYTWIFTSKRYFLMFISCLGQFFLGILVLNLNNRVAINDVHNKFNHKMLTFFIHIGALNMTGGLLGVCLCLVISEKNRLSDVIGDFIFFIDCYFSMMVILTIVGFSLSLREVTSKGKDSENAYSLIVSSAVLGSSFILGIIITFCSRYFRKRQPPKLEVEVVDLATLTPKMKEAYAALIDRNRKYNSGVSGAEALDLMEAYCNSPLEDMSCIVLRVFQPNEPCSNKPKKEQAAVWDTLDEENSIFNEDAEWSAEQSTLTDTQSKPISKNKLKRMAKKAEKKKNAQQLLELIEKNTKEDRELNTKLEKTEALVLLTSIENFDLTCTFKGKIGRMISKAFGKTSRYKLLCVRFGVLGFHWPFKRASFYCSKTKRPTARSAAVLSAISKWNSRRPSNEKCTLLLDSIYKSSVTSDAINFGGWVKIPLPSSHIIDLRPHKNQNLQQYLKSIKYRAQNRSFDAANGEVIECYNFEKQDCEKVIEMWSNIAKSRSENGQTSTLTSPDSYFIECLGKVGNKNKERTLLFLKVGDEVVASCVLFRLGDTITSDIQGLNHDISRKYKAYFVMMQEVIRIALHEGKSFVDFGPTTEKPKLDIGCKSVPLVGAMYATYSLLNPIIALSAKKVDV